MSAKELEEKTPSPKKYVILQETSGKDCESWYYFIRKEGNEDALNRLQEQLEKVKWFILDDYSVFDLDLEHFISETTATEMINVELNVYFHRKFDGVLKMIDFGLSERDKNKKKIKKINDIIGMGHIDKFIDEEDGGVVENEETSEEDSSEEDEETSSLTSSSSSSKKGKRKKKDVPKIVHPPIPVPKFATLKKKYK